MADFKQAIEWLKEGKKVRREDYDFFMEFVKRGQEEINSGYSFLHFKGIEDNREDDREQRLCLQDIEAQDWEIYNDCEKETLSDNIGLLDFGTILEKDFNKVWIKDKEGKVISLNELIKVNDVKEAIRKLKELFYKDIPSYEKPWLDTGIKEIFGDKLI